MTPIGYKMGIAILWLKEADAMSRHQWIMSENGTYHVMLPGNERNNLFHDQDDKQVY